MLKTYFIVALVAYLLGSIPFGYILVKLFLKRDIRKTGSGNIGATNVARSGKKGLAIATLLLDAAKGYAAVWITVYLVAPVGPFNTSTSEVREVMQAHYLVWGFGALMAVVGHMFPVWLNFSGGKGVATAVGAFLFLAPKSVGLAFIAFALLFFVSRIVSLSSIVASITFAIGTLYWKNLWLMWPAFYSWKYVALLWMTCALVILKHHSNIRRLINGTEPKFGTPRQAIPADPIQVEKNA